MGKSPTHSLGTLAMTALVVGSLIGSGIFSLPQNMAENAGAGAIMLAWAITFAGMLALTRIFQWLALNAEAAGDGLYGYARSGFGNYVGFSVAWGYWISVWITIVGYLVLIFDALGSFPGLEIFARGDSPAALLGGLGLLWSLHGFILLGVRSAALLNLVVTLAKLLPIGLFLVFALLAFELDVFRSDFWGGSTGLSVVEQLKSTMLYTVFVFLGIESATVYADRARDRAVISRATLLGFVLTFVLLVGVSLLSLGLAQQAELAGMRNPSMAIIMERAVGSWGRTLINAGLIVSVSGALLAWTLIASEILYLAARGHRPTAPSVFGRLNRHGTPANALWLTNSLVSVMLVVDYLSDMGYNRFVQLASSMALLPYLVCATFALKLCLTSEGLRVGEQPRMGLLFLTVLGTVYGLWLVYAGGLNFLLLSMMLYALGIPFFVRARHEQGAPAFSSGREYAGAIVVAVLGLYALYVAVVSFP